MSELAGFTYVHRAGTAGHHLMLFHGTGGDEHDLLDVGEFVAPGATLISPRGRAPEGALNRWFARLAPGVLDEDDIKRRAAEVADLVAAARHEHKIGGGQLWALGYSNGANIIAAALLLHGAIFDGAVLLRPMLPLQVATPPSLEHLPIYLAGGTRDGMIPPGSAQALATTLEATGADLLQAWRDTGHMLEPDELDAVREWLGQHSTRHR